MSQQVDNLVRCSNNNQRITDVDNSYVILRRYSLKQLRVMWGFVGRDFATMLDLMVWLDGLDG